MCTDHCTRLIYSSSCWKAIHLEMTVKCQSSLTALTTLCLLVCCCVHAAMDNATREKLLKLHNNARISVMHGRLEGQPIAKSIKPLKWNMELEKKAQMLADTCYFGPDSAIERKVPGFTNVGQNWAGASTVDIGFQRWLNEYKNYDFFNRLCLVGRCIHYTQIVWENTTDIGCGVATCPHSPFKLSIVCNYGPGGGCPRQFPYSVKGLYRQWTIKYGRKWYSWRYGRRCRPVYVKQRCNHTNERQLNRTPAIQKKRYKLIKQYLCPNKQKV
ncbi:venom allergen-like (VAL) 5 protein [Schistosoma mansoni]|uniref:venom allergen-like (VAL) 5 protein n=1 Tax=Schistosoma mansoni TaxID=6183 RepID=UPI00019B3769|nr:venom allergen-like (VAL) 5 protein [Schistosoma mansoni]|eukprot:XP_018644042.1 venom allergen-like (VAL) 5 protein [Schistosoma mansoni]